MANLDQVAAVTDGVGVIPPPPWISANVATIRERSGQRRRDGLAEPRVQLAMPATVYAELHNPQSGLRHQRGIELAQLGQGHLTRDSQPSPPPRATSTDAQTNLCEALGRRCRFRSRFSPVMLGP